MINQKKIGLALSGGGYRAAAFHLGTMRKLEELKILEKVDVISCTSGGAIIGAYYCLNKKHSFSEFEETFIKKLKQSIITKLIFILVFLASLFIGLLIFIINMGFFFWGWALLFVVVATLLLFTFIIFPSSKFIELIYDHLFFGKQTLKQLNESPILLINATNIETGRLWTFSQKKMGDSSYQRRKFGEISFKHEDFPISRAVASSTSVPFAFSPINIAKKFFSNPGDFLRIQPRLMDGGVYDNQGAHKITQTNSYYECDIIVISDAGMKFTNESSYRNNFSLLKRTSDIFMQRIRNLQFQHNLYYKNINPRRETAYLALTWEVKNCIQGFIDNIKSGVISDPNLLEFHKIAPSDIKNFNQENIRTTLMNSINFPEIQNQVLTFEERNIARNISTNLHSLSDHEINHLSNHAAVLTEVQIKLYCPSLFIESNNIV